MERFEAPTLLEIMDSSSDIICSDEPMFLDSNRPVLAGYSTPRVYILTEKGFIVRAAITLVGEAAD
jgi:hypothetical protein